MSLAAQRWPGDGPPVVAIHGLSSNAAFYVGVGERLAGRRPLLALDLRGRGDSDKPAEGYGMAVHADDVAAAMDADGIDRAVVVGHSMGAGVATVFAHRHPDRCAGVVLFDGGLQVFHDFFARPELAAEFMESGKGIEGRLHATFADQAAYRAHWAALDVFTPEEWGPWVDAYLDHDLGAGGRAKCLPDAIAYDALDLLQTAQSIGDVPIEIPVLAVHATEGVVHGTSPLVQATAIERMASTHPRFGAVEVAGTNHYTIALTDPAATVVADAIVAHANLRAMTETARPGRVYGGRSAAGRDAERRERLLAAGLEAFGTNGFQSTTIEQLCTAAGVATRSFYDLFAGREALLIALHDEINARALEAIVETLGAVEGNDIRVRAVAAFAAYLEVITTDPRWVRITLRETIGATPATYAARREALGRFASFIHLELDRLADAGVIPKRDHALTAIAVVGGLTALVESLLPPDEHPHEVSRARVDRVRDEGVRLILSASGDTSTTG